MCSKLHLNDLKTVAGVRDAIFHQWSVNNSTEHLFTPASIPPPSFISWGYNNYFINLLNALRSLQNAHVCQNKWTLKAHVKNQLSVYSLFSTNNPSMYIDWYEPTAIQYITLSTTHCTVSQTKYLLVIRQPWVCLLFSAQQDITTKSLVGIYYWIELDWIKLNWIKLNWII